MAAIPHGYEFFDGALWQAGSLWKMKWPKDAENDKFRNYWEDKSIEVYDFGIEMFKKKQNSSDELDYTWEKAEFLMWDHDSESFKLSS